MSNETTKELALKLVGHDGFNFERDQIIDAFALIEKIKGEVDAIVQAQAATEAKAEEEAAEARYRKVDLTFKKWNSRFLLKMGKQRFIAIFGEYSTSDEAGAAYAQLLAPLGDIDIWKRSVTVDKKEVYLWLVNLRGLNLCRHLVASEHGGYQEEIPQGIYAVRNRLVDYLNTTP